MNILSRFTSGLGKTSGKLSDGISSIFMRRKLDQEALDALEELLIQADLGVRASAELISKLAEQRLDKDISENEVKEILAAEIAKILQPLASPLNPPAGGGTIVIMAVGVNGNGKTTTLGKLAAAFQKQGKKVVLAAADTFRAAAVEQLQQWGARANAPVVVGAPESDPAAVAFRAYAEAKNTGADVLLVDTAGRLQNKSNLMAELQKISKALNKADAGAPHHVIQVLDATTGGNALSQVKAFKELVQVTGLIVTKLDGTAKGGVLVALAKEFGLPIHFIGTGEGVGDLRTFQAIEFSRNLMGLAVGY